MYLQAGLVHLVLPSQVAAGVVTESDESWWSTTVGHIARTTLAFVLATNAVAAQQSYADEVIVTPAATFVEDDYKWPVVFAPKGINNVVFIPADSDDIVTAVVLPDLGDYIVQEIDGVSRFVLEDGSGAILLEVQTSPVEEDYWQNRVRPVSSTFIVPQPWNFDQNEPSGTLGTAPPEEDYWQNGVLPVGQTSKQPIWWEQEDVTPTILPPEEDLTPVFVPAWGKYTLFSTIDEDLPIAPVAGLDEGEWQRSVVQSIQVKQLQLFDQDESGSLYGIPDENERWENPNKPLRNDLRALAPWIGDEQEPAGSLFGVPEEDSQFPYAATRSTAVRPVFSDDDVLAWTTDEDGWLPSSRLVRSAPTVFIADDDYVTPSVAAEDDSWKSSVSVPIIQPWQPPRGEDEAGFLYGVPDDDQFWQNPNRPCIATIIWPQQASFDVQEPAGALFGTAEEDSFVPRIAQLVTTSYRVFIADDEIAILGLDEDGQIPLIQPCMAVAPRVAAVDDDLPVVASLDEDYWLNSVRPVIVSYWSLPQWIFDQNEPSGTLGSTPFDEDKWSVSRPAWASNVVFSVVDDDLPIAPVQTVDEEYWQNNVKPVPATYLLPVQWNFEQNEPSGTLGTAPSNEDDKAVVVSRWASNVIFSPVDDDLPVAAVVDDDWLIPAVKQNVVTVTKAIAADDDLPVPVTPDEDGWLPQSMQRVSLVVPITADDDLSWTIDEDYWWNSTKSVPASYLPLYPWLFDQNEPSGTLGTVPPDEDNWAVVVLKWPRNVAVPSVDDDLPAPVQTVDEEYWQNGVKPVPASYAVPVQWGYEQHEPSGTLGTAPPEEDSWSVTVPKQIKNVVVGSIDDDLPIAVTVLSADEDGWLVAVPKWSSGRLVAFRADDEITLTQNEDYWYVARVIVPPRLVKAFIADDEFGRVFRADDEGVPVVIRAPIKYRPAITVDDEIVRPLKITEADWFPPAPWTLHKSPLIFGSWLGDDAAMMVQPVANQCFPAGYNCVSGSVPVFSTSNPVVPEFSLVNASAPIFTVSGASASVCVDVIPDLLIRVDDDSCISFGTLELPEPPSQPPPPSFPSATQILWLGADSGVSTLDYEYMGIVI